MSETDGCIRVHVVARTLPGWGLAALIEQVSSRMRVSGICTNLDQLDDDLALVGAHVIVLDLDCNGQADPVARLRKRTAAGIVVVAGSDDPATLDRAILSGARGVLRQDETPETLLRAIERVHAGDMWVDRPATLRVLSQLSTGTAKAPPEAARLALLTPRERETVVVLVKHAGATGKQLAEKLHISEHTLRNRLTAIYAKLELANRVDLFAYAQRHVALLG